MRKLKLQIQVTVDGYAATLDDEMEGLAWEPAKWDKELTQYIYQLTDSCDTILIGRKMAEGFMDYWPAAGADPADPHYEFAQKINRKTKILFSNTLAHHNWENTLLTNGDLSHEVNKLKKQGGPDLIAYGGISFAGDLIRENLVDELHLFVNPVAYGTGRTIFQQKTGLEIRSTQLFPCGMSVLHCRIFPRPKTAIT